MQFFDVFVSICTEMFAFSNLVVNVFVVFMEPVV